MTTRADRSENDLNRQYQDESNMKILSDANDQDMAFLGFENQNNARMFVIPEKDRHNIIVFGKNKTTKTTILREMIMQDILKNKGFLLIDPTRTFAKEILSIIPRSKHDDVVYVSHSHMSTGKMIIRFNPLESHSIDEKRIRVKSYMYAFRRFFTDVTDSDFEELVQMTTNLIIKMSKRFSFQDMLKVLVNAKDRKEFVMRYMDEYSQTFWMTDYPRLISETEVCEYGRFERIVTTPFILALFDTVESSVSIMDIINKNKIIIVDSGIGGPSPIVEYLGTLFLSMFETEGEIMFMNKQNRDPFNIYMNDLSQIELYTVKQFIDNSKKYNFKVTATAESVRIHNDLSGRNQNMRPKKCVGDLVDQFEHKIIFDSDTFTYDKIIKSVDNNEYLPCISSDRFILISNVTMRVIMGRIRDLKIKERWKEVSDASIKRYGKESTSDSTHSRIFSMKHKNNKSENRNRFPYPPQKYLDIDKNALYD